MQSTRVVAFYSVLLLACFGLSQSVPIRAQPLPELPGKAALPPKAAGPVRETKFLPATLPDVRGHVTAVSDKAISIRIGPDKEFMTLPFHDALAAGGIHELAMYWNGYRVQDVKVGDEVTLAICHEGQRAFCAEISIRKRPGGRVPESFKTGDHIPSYATRQNAENDWKDFGIPLPKNCRNDDEEFRKLIYEWQRNGEEINRELTEWRKQEELKKQNKIERQ